MLDHGTEPRSAPQRFGAWVLFDRQQWKAWLAEEDAHWCEEPPTTLLSDTPRPALSFDLVRRLECISSLNGCIMARVAAPMFVPYDARTLDHAAHLRLAAALLWLRETRDDRPIAQRFAARPAELRSGSRASGYDAGAGIVFVDNLQAAREPRFELAISDARAGGASRANPQ